jgi:hypothetical protein
METISNIIGEIAGSKAFSDMELMVDDVALKLTADVWMKCFIRNNKCKSYFTMLYIVHILLFLALTFGVTSYSHKLQGKLSFIQNGVVSKMIWHFLFRNLKLPLHFN